MSNLHLLTHLRPGVVFWWSQHVQFVSIYSPVESGSGHLSTHLRHTGVAAQCSFSYRRRIDFMFNQFFRSYKAVSRSSRLEVLRKIGVNLLTRKSLKNSSREVQFLVRAQILVLKFAKYNLVQWYFPMILNPFFLVCQHTDLICIKHSID